MITECPHCKKGLNFNEVQQEKLQFALAKLTTGALKLGCPHCQTPIHIKADGTVADEQPAAAGEPAAPAAAPAAGDSLPEPPAYPDISWLASGLYEQKELVEDVPKVLVLMSEGEGQEAVGKAFTDRGYQAEFPESAADAIAQMRFVLFKAVVLHSKLEGNLENSSFHQHMESMPMASRRSIYYVLVGPEFHTLYDLEALANSANAVVNENEVAHIDTILKKGMRDYDELFGPYLEALANK